ncbi:MAG: hypothetical protein OXC09_13685 [Truepera sp.]|nr:hypothetical protein [Truepera sp.]
MAGLVGRVLPGRSCQGCSCAEDEAIEDFSIGLSGVGYDRLVVLAVKG